MKSGVGTWELAQLNDYDLIILDVMLPRKDGFPGVSRIARRRVCRSGDNADGARRS